MTYEFFIHNKTLTVGKIHCYNGIQKIAKPPSSSYLKIAKHAHLSFGIKWLISLPCMILGLQNLPRILLELHLEQQESTSISTWLNAISSLLIIYTCAIRQLCLRQCDRSSPEVQELSKEESWISTDINSKLAKLLVSSKCPSKNLYTIHTECSGRGWDCSMPLH